MRHKRLDLSIEAYVQKHEYQGLFMEEERRIYKERLAGMEFDWGEYLQ